MELPELNTEGTGRALIIFVKNPEKGKVKTRLAADVGDGRALNIYLQLLDITRSAACKVNCHRHLFYSDFVDDNDDWSSADFTKHVQCGDDLGDRMLHALQNVLNGDVRKAVIIGSDCPNIRSGIVESAFAALDEADVVIGPAKDGGYYLIGMKEPLSFLFQGREWSTPSVCSSTVRDLQSNGRSYFLLPELSDVDTVRDLHLLP